MNNIIILFIIISILIIFNIKYNYNKRLNRIIKYLNKTDKILDFGCGKCCETYKLKQLNYDITGLDVNNNNNGLCLIPEFYDGKNINYPDNYFDVVICSFVLHHIPHYKYTLTELRRITKKYILIYEDTPNNSIDRYFTKLHSRSDWGKCEGCFKSTSEWINFLKYDFKIINIEEISRFEIPFADMPLIYPVPATFFVIEK